MKKSLQFLAVSLLCWFLLVGTAAAGHPAATIMQFYPDDHKNQSTIEPYIVTILALNEVENGRNLSQVKQFILWYFSKLNYPDYQGLSGTIYVYTLEGDQARSTNKYDSVDGYAGMFLHLLRQYAVKSGDIQLLKDNWRKIEDVAALIPSLQDKDGLTWATPRYKVKYLMDNCESYGGIIAYMELRTLVGMPGSLQYYAKSILLRAGIREKLYQSDKKLFYWAIVEDGTPSASVWDTFYPDSIAQLFPIYFGLLNDAPSIQETLWRDFCRKYAVAMQNAPAEQRIVYELTKKMMKE